MILVVICWFSLNYFFGSEYKKIDDNRADNPLKFLIETFKQSTENLGEGINKAGNIFSQ